MPHRFFALGFLLVLEEGDERRRKRTLAQQPAEQVRNLKGVDKCAGDRAIPHKPGVHHHPHHPKQATEQRGPGHGARGFEHVRQRGAG